MKFVLLLWLEGKWHNCGCPHIDDWIKEPIKRTVRLVSHESAREDYGVRM